MARRKKQVRSVTERRPWDTSWAELFRLAGDDWTPPAYVTIRHFAHATILSAAFGTPSGRPAALRIKIDRASRSVVEESLHLAFAFSSAGGAR